VPGSLHSVVYPGFHGGGSVSQTVRVQLLSTCTCWFLKGAPNFGACQIQKLDTSGDIFVAKTEGNDCFCMRMTHLCNICRKFVRFIMTTCFLPSPLPVLPPFGFHPLLFFYTSKLSSSCLFCLLPAIDGKRHPSPLHLL
jgi:hypothetical protein